MLKNIAKTLIPQIIMGKDKLNAEEAAQRGLLLEQTIEEKDGALLLRLKLTNASAQAIHLDKLNWHREGDCADALNAADMQLYLEGWQMASPCGVRAYGDEDYKFDPWYVGYAVAEPADYDEAPNHFRAEHMMMFHSPASGGTVLMGFVTTADQFGHFKCELGEKGVAALDVRCACDGMLVEPGDAVCSEVLALMLGTDGYALQQEYAALWGKTMGAKVEKDAPIGWCSWYYYFSDVTEENIYGNVKFLRENANKYPLKYIQLDDGYQSACGDWLVCNEKFPHGLEGVAKAVKDGGFIPAVWFAPFLAEENSVILREHPDWMIHDKDGKVLLEYPWRGNKAAILDGTNPEVQQHFRQMFAKVRGMGFEYVKLDFLVTACTMRKGVLYDKKATRAQALRRGLEAMREGFGQDGYILGCTVPFGPAVGVVDGERISTDITPYWVPEKKFYDEAPTVPNVCRNVLRHTYMNKKLWNNDPDTLIVRDDNTKLTYDEVKLWYEIVRLTGGMLLLSDNFLTLTPERSAMIVELLKDPNAYNARSVDFWNRGIPAILRAEHKQDGHVETALFNFEDEAAVVQGIELPAHSCKLI